MLKADTASRQSQKSDPMVDTRLKEKNTIEVLETAVRLCGSALLAQIWFHEEPIDVFAYKTAEYLVASDRAAELMLYLQSLEAGAAG